jgi:predicted O-methyltransferase YrrM
MRADEVAAITRLIRRRRPQRVLEFGAGGSTTTFALEPSVKEWWSLEHSPEWIGKVLSRLDLASASRITLVSCAEEQVIERINQLLPIGFDMFFVDGFDRCAILERLRTHLLDTQGFVVLHDSTRARYRQATEKYTKRTVLADGNGRHQGLMLLEMSDGDAD